MLYSVVFPAQPEVQRKTWSNLPAILPEHVAVVVPIAARKVGGPTGRFNVQSGVATRVPLIVLHGNFPCG